MELIILSILIGWLCDTDKKLKERRELLKWREQHPNWQDTFGG